MGFDVADDDVAAAGAEAVALDEHLEGLADTGGGTEVDLELAKLLLADDLEELVRAGFGGC